MSDQPQPGTTEFEPQFVRNMIESSLRIGLIFLLLYYTYSIIQPFIVPTVWGAVIGIAAFPLVVWLEPKLGNRRGLAAALVSLLFIALLVAPAWTVTDSIVGGLKSFTETVRSGEFHIPPPPERVASFPVIGENLFTTWSQANSDLSAAVRKAAPQIQDFVGSTLKQVGGGLASVLLFVVSIIIAGGFMAYADSCSTMAQRFFVRVGGLQPGGEWATMCVATVRSVLKGVVGVALIQTCLIAIGLFAMGIPAAAIISAIVMVLAIAQIPVLLVVLPVIIYAFANYDTTPAVLFTIWQVIAAASDNVLKPMLMGRGVDIPMPIILFGAIGGMISGGIIGLFIGAVVLSIWYKLFTAWLQQTPQ